MVICTSRFVGLVEDLGALSRTLLFRHLRMDPHGHNED